MSQPSLRYYKAQPQNVPTGTIPGSEWVIFLGATPANGEVVVELHGVWEEQAEKIRKAIVKARSFGRREVADEISSQAQALRLQDTGELWHS